MQILDPALSNVVTCSAWRTVGGVKDVIFRDKSKVNEFAISIYSNHLGVSVFIFSFSVLPLCVVKYALFTQS